MQKYDDYGNVIYDSGKSSSGGAMLFYVLSFIVLIVYIARGFLLVGNEEGINYVDYFFDGIVYFIIIFGIGKIIDYLVCLYNK